MTDEAARNASSRVLERGDIFFAYRPRVGEERPASIDDVQRLFLILRPDGGRVWRRLVIGRKRLPEPEYHERIWSFVDRVERSGSEIARDLGAENYETKTRGERHQPSARPAGEGRYAIVEHGGHVHLAYALELPERPGAPQRALRIEPQASYIVAVANPDRRPPAPSPFSRQRTPEYSAPLRERFAGRRFIALAPEYLDVEGCELVLIGAAADAEAELGIALDAKRETEHSAETFRALGMERARHPASPLLEGVWD